MIIEVIFIFKCLVEIFNNISTFAEYGGLDMGLLEIIQSIKYPIPEDRKDAEEKEAERMQKAADEIFAYADSRGVEEFRTEVLTEHKKTSPKAGKRSRKASLRRQLLEKRLEAIILQACTGINTRLDIKKLAMDKDLVKIANVTATMTFVEFGAARTYFQKLVERRGLQRRNRENRQFIDDLDAAYVERSDPKKLAAMMKLGLNHSIQSDANNYSRFYHVLSEKLQGDEELQYRLFIKFTGIRALEELTTQENGKMKSFDNLCSLALLCTGKVNSLSEAMQYFKQVCKRQSMSPLTPEHEDYVDRFDADYLKSASTIEIERMTRYKTKAINPESTKYSLFLHTLAKKISQDEDLQKALVQKITGATRPKEIMTGKSYKALAQLCCARKLAREGDATRYLRDLLGGK